MKNITLIFIGFFLFTTFLNAQNTNTKNYFDDQFVGGLADNGDIIWVGVDNSLVKIDKTSGATINSYTIPISNEYNYLDRYAASISLDNNGVAWITSPSGIESIVIPGNYLVIFDGVNNWIEIQWPNLFVAHLIIDKEDKVWVSELLGLHEYDGTGGWIDHNMSSPQWPYWTTTFAVDSENSKWLGLTYDANYYPGISGGVLAKLDGTLSTVFTSPYLSGGVGWIWSMDVSPQGIVWMGTQGNGLVAFDGTNWEVYNSSNSEIPPKVVQNVTVEGANIIWMSTSSGLTRFDGDVWKTFNTDNSMLPSNSINSILIEENGTKWVGTDKGLISFKGNALSTSDEQYSGVQINLFPNPANDFITLKMPLDVVGSTVDVFSIQGKVMKSMRMTNDIYKMKIGDLASGMYFIRLQTRNGIGVKKFVKQN